MEETRKPLLPIVDDDQLIACALSASLEASFAVITSHSRTHAVQMLRQLRHLPVVALIDLGLPPTPCSPEEGFALISEIVGISPETRIVVLSGRDDDASARHARALGAVDFVTKPCDSAALLRLLTKTLRLHNPPATGIGQGSSLVGHSPAMEKLRAQIRQYADSSFPVLIEGESGSGKEVIAKECLCASTTRRQRPFLALNCAAISPTLVEPTLFGCAKGAYTGANESRSGYFQEAADGTLFLDEIGELPLELQAKLLRVLENGEFQRVGETRTRVSRARIIAATNRDLRREIKVGRFRADLYHRLSVCTLSAPPLRDMEDDRLLLLHHFRDQYAEQNKRSPFALDASATALWRSYQFPGNARELRNIVIRLLVKYPGRMIGASELEPEFDLGEYAGTTDAALGAQLPSSVAAMIPLASRRLAENTQFDLDHALRVVERGYIEAALRLCRGNVSQAARMLGLSRTTLYSRMAEDPT